MSIHVINIFIYTVSWIDKGNFRAFPHPAEPGNWVEGARMARTPPNANNRAVSLLFGSAIWTTPVYAVYWQVVGGSVAVLPAMVYRS